MIPALLLALLACAPAEAQTVFDDRVQILILPADGDGVDRALESALARSVDAREGFRRVALPDEARARLESDPDCRRRPACFQRLAPEEVELILAPRVQRRAGSQALDVHLYRGDARIARWSAFAAPGDISGVDAGAAYLLAGRTRIARLYAQASAGDADACAALDERFPEHPYALEIARSNACSRPTRAASIDAE